MISPISKDPYGLADEKLIRKIVRRLPKSGRLREWAEAALAGEPIPTDAIPDLCDVVRGANGAIWPHRLVACMCLERANWRNNNRDAVVQALRAAAASIVSKARSEPSHVKAACGLSFLWTVSMMIALIAIIKSERRDLSWIVDAGITLFVGGLVSYAAWLVTLSVQVVEAHSRTRRMAIRMLGEMGDCIAVGEVAQAVYDSDIDIAAEAKRALPGLLEAVQPKHYGKLSRDTVPAICQLLSSIDRTLAVQAINALMRAGDGRAAESLRYTLEASTQILPWLKHAPGLDAEQAVVDAALQALPILEERLRNETAAARLLRPAESPANPAELLLRPAGSSTTVPEEQLLRPAEADETVRVEHVE